ncbi:STAS domain-containing protein [Gloeocapsa sp. PCC 73106]|uniref:STAS domain-containing protein n=1 Tax=Gloeocapsa sp. PCC 73106 TaxID=102232 RepID=UPI0002ABBB23|nr:STAS domain-containing protein [Gloeocapsa sp. PCC 73106]ELR97226.1 anti-anti-sigma factor [Gloeocapsa sp. PCC 73106]
MRPQIQYLQPVGILDGTKSEEFRQEITTMLAEGAKIIVIDFQQVTFMDSSGLGALVLSLKTLRSADVKLYLCSINQQVKMLFELTSMDRVFEIFANRQELEAQILN